MIVLQKDFFQVVKPSQKRPINIKQPCKSRKLPEEMQLDNKLSLCRLCDRLGERSNGFPCLCVPWQFTVDHDLVRVSVTDGAGGGRRQVGDRIGVDEVGTIELENTQV